MNRMVRDALILILLPLVVIAFSLWEWGGINNDPWHSISFYAKEYVWLKWTIAALPVVGAVIFEIWWLDIHMNQVIPRL